MHGAGERQTQRSASRGVTVSALRHDRRARLSSHAPDTSARQSVRTPHAAIERRVGPPVVKLVVSTRLTVASDQARSARGSL
jgi:hypothetical protein